jgi:hypothetical protein
MNVKLSRQTGRLYGDTRKTGGKALHVVSAWAAENRLVFGQVRTEEKSNEITAIPALLEKLAPEAVS